MWIRKVRRSSLSTLSAIEWPRGLGKGRYKILDVAQNEQRGGFDIVFEFSALANDCLDVRGVD